MTTTADDLEAVKHFATRAGRAVLVTHRQDGGLQSSPMSIAADDDGNVLTATRAKNAKVYNLVRDPRAALCLFDDQWPGPWMHVEGVAEIERLPEAMPLLLDYYARRGQDTSTDAFRERMQNENRVLIRVRPRRVVRTRST
jgi:PPOX class probable F420-dependent enzyme